MPEKKSPQAVVAGHICLDIIPDVGHLSLSGAGEFYTPGKLLNTGPAALSTGGPVSNTGLALIKLGIDTALMGKVGADPFGQVVQLLLKDRWGVSEGMIVAGDATTSYTVALTPPGLDRMFLHCPGANDTFSSDDVDYDLVARAGLFHLGYPPLMRRMYENNGRELVDIFRRVNELGVTTSLDMSLPDPNSAGGKVDWLGILERLLPHVDLFLPSAEETLFMLNRARFDEYRSAGGDMLAMLSGDDLHDLSDRAMGMGAKVVGIKCGYRGVYLRTAGAGELSGVGRAKPSDDWPGRELWHPAFSIDRPPSATGSGDSAIAGFVAAYLRGLSPEQALRYANAVGACNVMAPDALSGIKTWDELNAVLDAGWDADPLEVAGAGWRCQVPPLWTGPGEG